jgi:hypothetical protein
VEAIANPEVNVNGDNMPGEVQPPPETDIAAEVAAALDLPPIVEPAAIKVELPQPLDATTSSSEGTIPPAPAPEAPSAETPVTAPADESLAAAQAALETPAPVGPSLAEALAAEEEEEPPFNQAAPEESTPSATDDSPPAATDDNPEPEEVPETAPEAPAPTPARATPQSMVLEDPSSIPEPTVISPTESSPTSAPDNAPRTATRSGDVNGKKKVIVPISDPTVKPDLNALLAAEERREAVENPTANTLVTPGNLPNPVPQNDELNNIAL